MFAINRCGASFLSWTLYEMAIKLHSVACNIRSVKARYSVLLSICAVLKMNFYPAAVATVGSARHDGTNFGSYLEVYPPGVNLSRSYLDCTPEPTDNRTCPLYVALMMSFGGEYESSGVIASVQYALDQINSVPDLLPGYSLHYTLTDSQVQLYSLYSLNLPARNMFIISLVLKATGH